MFWFDVFVMMYEVDYLVKVLEKVIIMSGFVKCVMMGEFVVVKVVVFFFR